MSRAVNSGGVLILSKQDALALVDKCQEENYKIYGIDGFYVDNDIVQPTLENSITFDKKEGYFQYEASKSFIKMQRDKRLYFEIVCDQ